MPVWFTSWANDIALGDFILWVFLIGGGLTLLVKLWPFLSNAVQIVDALVKLPDVAEKVDSLTDKVESIYHETHNNNGSSIKDSVDRIEKHLGI